MATNIILCVIGFIVLIYAADKLVEGASNLAMSFGVSKTVVGLTIVAAGTSLPELVVSINASIKGNASLSLGNAVGSNIMNIALILGVSALICPIVCEKTMVKRDTPLMIGATLLVWYLAYTNQTISYNEGIILLVLFFSYFIMTYIVGKKEAAENPEPAEATDKPLPSNLKSTVYVIIGFIGLVLGAEALVRGAVEIAQSLGVSDEVIGLTLVAIGTSLPELATSIVAARKGQSGIAVGNVVGSNIFNILAIIGTAATIPMFSDKIAPLAASEQMLGLHIPIMTVTALALLPIMKTGMKIVRLEGLILLVGYIAYTVMLIQTAGAAAPVG
ncbi:MAG: calcium/sodium antiporter [Candidatus Riflebacteria bacterium]|nr:calcium/sodium antiporter [Candidatus Riflebacteria bacterium]